MARNSKAKTTRQGLSGQPDNQDIWRNGLKRLIDQGKLMWMLGEGLKAAQEAQARGWSPADEQGLVNACYQWVQQSLSGVAFEAPAAAPAPLRGGQRSDGDTIRPGLDLRGCDLSKLECPVLWLGSRVAGKVWKSMALGVGVDGYKRVLSLMDGSVRERSVADGLLDELVQRGFDSNRAVLVITEGSRILDASLQMRFSAAVVTHCRTRVIQDVLAHVPESRRDTVQAELEGSWSMPWDAALELLKDLGHRLKDEAPGASERLSRSIEASVTLSRLNLSGSLKERLQTAGILRKAFKECLGAQGSVARWLKRSRRLVGWRGLELLAHKLGETKAPINKAAPPLSKSQAQQNG